MTYYLFAILYVVLYLGSIAGFLLGVYLGSNGEHAAGTYGIALSIALDRYARRIAAEELALPTKRHRP